MSIAGMVDIAWLESNAKLLNLIKEERTLRAERESKLALISQLESSLETVDARLAKIKETTILRKSDYDSWWQSVQNLKDQKEIELQSLHEKEKKLSSEKDSIILELKKAKEELDEWHFSAKMTMADLEERKTALLSKAAVSSEVTIPGAITEEEPSKDNTPDPNPALGDSIWD